ncbi:PPE domain-containing protein [Mycolicibacterium sphagni]|uniref:PPE domain-containing protein n=1 Tax=Mycolicibacterium sphagni TaxID=1786 RepID=A0ABX2K4D6_9MYCO|nr:PPE domain-containing protein [Mycolicibacterium sphagni]NTY62597.1 PPE domain-containing protein [Mycolicibacterium sphagni]
MTIILDATGLTAAAGQLSGSTQVHTPAVAQPPGLDTTSVSAVAQINAASGALATLLNHGSALREVGGIAVAGTASTLLGQDESNASSILNGSSASGPATSAPTLPSVPHPSVPGIPTVPAALVPLPGEAHSQALYGGPGSSSLHSFADEWANHATQLRQQAETITSAGHAIDASWDDGKQRAGANTREHAEWLTSMGDQADKLSKHARTVAEGFDTAKANTPSPHEFAQAHQDLQHAMQRFVASKGANAAEVQMHTQDIADKQTQATTAATGYHTQVTEGSLSSATESLKTAPPIAGGSGSPDPGSGKGAGVQAVDYKPGDEHHYAPIIRGQNGLGPAQTPDGPRWVELGDRSGNWVRQDELPGLQLLKPGAPGPATLYDGHGNAVPWVELGKGSGAWAPQSDFPKAQFLPPGALGQYGWDEYLPNSGIWLPSKDLKIDPLDPSPPSGAVRPA